MRRAALICLVVTAAPACKTDRTARGERLRLLPPRISLRTGGLGFRVHPYTLGQQAGEVWVATLDPAKVRLRVLPAPYGPAALSEFPRPAAPDRVVLNGGFYDHAGPMGLVVSDGRLVHPLRRGGGSGVFYLAGGRAAISHRDGVRDLVGIEQAVQSIDRLAQDRAILVRRRGDLPQDARSGVAVDGAGRVLLLAVFDRRAVIEEGPGRVVLGRKSSTVGPTLYDFAELLVRPEAEGGLGAAHALNLDGGFSTAMQVRLSGQRHDLIGHRGTINCLLAEP